MNTQTATVRPEDVRFRIESIWGNRDGSTVSTIRIVDTEEATEIVQALLAAHWDCRSADETHMHWTGHCIGDALIMTIAPDAPALRHCPSCGQLRPDDDCCL